MIKENVKINSWIWLIAFSFFLRFIVVFFFTNIDTDLYSSNVNEWHILSDNLIKYNTYSFYVFEGEAIPSAFMPPLYAFFIYLLKIIYPFEVINLLYLIIFIHFIWMRVNKIFVFNFIDP